MSFRENVSGRKKLNILCELRVKEVFQKEEGRLDLWQNFLLMAVKTGERYGE
jgi:hypothetical protein